MIVGPALSRSGYGEQTRFAIESLKDSKKYDLYLHNTNWGASSWISHDEDCREYIDSLISKTTGLPEDFRADISLQVTVPNEFKVYSPINIGYTAGIETDQVDDSWVFSANLMDGIIVPSEHSKQSFENASTEKLPLRLAPRVVGFAHELNNKYQNKDVIKNELSSRLSKYNFLTVAQVSPRKNIFNLVKWFLKSFGSREDVSLTLKLHKQNCSTIDKFDTASRMSSFITEIAPKKKCKVNLLHGDLSKSQMYSLYNNCGFTHYITTSHGEGFGLPIFEAACAGLIVVAPAWSGQMDYLAPKGGTDLFVPIKHTIEKVKKSSVWPGVINETSNWCHVSQEHFEKSVTLSIDQYSDCELNAKKLSDLIKKKFTKKKQSFIFNQTIEEFINNKEKNSGYTNRITK